MTVATHPTGRAALNAEFRRRFRAHCRPRPRLTMSEWAERYRVINGAPWRNDTAPYLAPIMDAISDPAVQEVVFVAPSQSGKSEVIINTLGYFVHQEPSPQLLVQPTVEMGERFSKERLALTIRETPALAERIRDAKSRDSGNTMTSKSYPGGQLDIVGANAPAGLAMSPKRVVLLDERDRHPKSAGTEGDVKAIAKARTRKWRHRRKMVEVSSPTDEESSLINPSYQEGTRQTITFQCPQCGERQTPTFAALKWETLPTGEVDAGTVHVVCVSGCRLGLEDEADVKRSAWPSEPQRAKVPHKVSFWLHGLLAAFHSWLEIAGEFVAANGDPDPASRAQRLRAFFNTTLGELYRDKAFESRASALLSRAKPYDGGDPDAERRFDVPAWVGRITVGVDVQHDRLECGVWGWGIGQQAARLAHVVIVGDVQTAEPWERLTTWRRTTWRHEAGATMGAHAVAIDAGDGATAAVVYRYCSGKLGERVYAVKGSNNPEAPPLPKKPTPVKGGRLFVIGVNGLTERWMRRLDANQPGPGYIHLNETTTEDWVRQFTGMERVVDPKTRKRRWQARKGQRVEVIDCANYALAALELSTRDDELVEAVEAMRVAGERAKAPKTEAPAAPAKTALPSAWLPRTGGWRRGG